MTQDQRLESLSKRMGSSYDKLSDEPKVAVYLDQQDLIDLFNGSVFRGMPHEVVAVEYDNGRFLLRQEKKS